MRWVAVAIGIPLWLGCECGEQATRAPSEQVTAQPSEPHSTEPPEPAREAEERAPMVDPARAAEVRAAVREGRRAARAQRWDDALAAFDRALRIVPGAPRVRCEAGFVAHRAGNDRRAAREMDLALALLPDPERGSVPEELRVPLAMCFYNRGLVHEALEKPWHAARSYESSLALRPHPAVQARLDALDQMEARRLDGLDPSASVDDVRGIVATTHCGESCDDDAGEEESEEGHPDPSCSDVTQAEGTQLDGTAVFDVSSPGCLVESRFTVIAVRARSGWALFEVAGGETATTDSFYRYEADFRAGATAARVGEHLVRFDVRSERGGRYGDDVSPPDGVSEEDDPECLADHYESESVHEVVLCRTDGVLPRCGSLVLGRAESSTREVYCARSNEVPEWARGEGEDEEGDPGDEQEELADRLELTFDGGVAVIGHREGVGRLEDEPAPGRYELDALFESVLREIHEYVE
jgi:hypothetical protein